MLRDELADSGNFFFRWRGYLPFLILPLVFIALRNGEVLEKYNTVDEIYEVLCFLISLTGLLFRFITVGFVPAGTSGRNKSRQIAEHLNTTGMYSIVRNPLYFGNLMVFSGIMLFTQRWWLILIGLLMAVIYFEMIILAEEKFLYSKFGDTFLNWTKRTPVIIPKFRLWIRPELPFSFKRALTREYPGVFALVSAFAFLDMSGDLLTEGKFEIDFGWAVLFLISFVFFLTIFFLKKKTKVLKAPGR